MNRVNIAVIGAGFYGTSIAIEIKKRAPNINVDLFEKKKEILKGTSGKNQFRLHRGYHYPRSHKTFIECEASNRSFENFFKDCFIQSNNFYSISKYQSKIDIDSFLKYLNKVRLPYKFFQNHQLINKEHSQGIVLTNEKIIDIAKTRQFLLKEISKRDINLLINHNVNIDKNFINKYDHIILATYENNNFLKKNLNIVTSKYYYQLVEKIIIECPKEYKNFSCVVLDGNFMSIDPFKKKYHIIGHVTKSVIKSTNSKIGIILNKSQTSKYNDYIFDNSKSSLFPKIKKDFCKYFNNFENVKYCNSFYVIRSTKKNEEDERTTDIELDNKIISVHSGKWINCVEAAKTVSKIIL